MLRHSAGGLTADDFHPEGFINPRDVLTGKNRQMPRLGGSNKAVQASLHQPNSPVGNQTHTCCGKEQPQSCVELDNAGTGSVDTCEGDCDQCEDCLEDHHNCEDSLIECVDNCDDCINEHDAACGQHGPVCTEECNDCDFSCFDCIDWNVFEKEKDLGLSYTVPILEQADPNASTQLNYPAPHADLVDVELNSAMSDSPVPPPVDLSMHHYCQNNNQLPPWNSFAPNVYCSPGDLTFNTTLNESLAANLQGPWGCHPAAAHRPPQSLQTQQPAISQQRPLPDFTPVSITESMDQKSAHWAQPSSSSSLASPDASSNCICEWVMPCGTVCGASFAAIADLKKHLKSSHTLKGTTSCGWQGCSAAFASDAALTGHISKKHLSAAIADEDGPFKCTFAGCSKSFRYKQVRDDHVASSHNGSKMFCDICKQWLNAEGSNFKRHLASHQPKHQHPICKFHHLGCKRRFPRLDNLRRHEACCKFGKKAAMHHHHHHRHLSHR